MTQNVLTPQDMTQTQEGFVDQVIQALIDSKKVEMMRNVLATKNTEIEANKKDMAERSRELNEWIEKFTTQKNLVEKGQAERESLLKEIESYREEIEKQKENVRKIHEENTKIQDEARQKNSHRLMDIKKLQDEKDTLTKQLSRQIEENAEIQSLIVKEREENEIRLQAEREIIEAKNQQISDLTNTLLRDRETTEKKVSRYVMFDKYIESLGGNNGKSEEAYKKLGQMVDLIKTR